MGAIYLIIYRSMGRFENRGNKITCFFISPTYLLALAFSCLYNAYLSAQTPSSDNILFVKQGSAGDGSSWANALDELSEALSWANHNWDADSNGPLQIWVATGKYLPTNSATDRNAAFQLANGIKVYGGFLGTEGAFTERDRTKYMTILSGDIDGNDEATVITDTEKEIKGNNSYTVVNGSGTDCTAVLDGFIITAGSANDNTKESLASCNSGGGIYLYQGNPTLANLVIMGNQAVFGGGIYNRESSPSLTGVNISNNKALGGDGDGIFNESNSQPDLTNVVIIGGWENGVGDYSITMSNGDIVPILTIVAHSDQSKVYSGDDPILTYTASGFLHGDGNSLLSGSLSREIGEDVGKYLINQGTLSATNYISSFVSADFFIVKSPQEIAFTSPKELLLSTRIQQLTASASSGLPVTLQLDHTSIASLAEKTLHMYKTGTITVTALQNGNNNYEEAELVSISIRIVDPVPENIPLRVCKVLSPNGDGINDFLVIEGIERYRDNKLIVFDQGGNILANIEGYNNGTKVFDGKGLSNDTYFYYLDVTIDGKQRRLKGFFELRNY